jgi:hypothetical protein
MPLQVGNVWVYHTSSQIFMGGRGYTKYKITGLMQSNGKTYYQVQQTYYHISGIPPGCGIPFFNNIRLDSNTMNIYVSGGGCNSTERLLDSLMARKNDTAWICRPNSFTHCIDTNTITIFTAPYKTKKFNNSGSGNGTIYAKGIGIFYWGFSEAMTQCNDTLRGCVVNGVLYGDTNTLVGINQISSEVPEQFSLSQNYPNPFNPATHFEFRIADFGLVRLIVYNAVGEEIETVVNREFSPGTYRADFDGSNLPSGVYYYRLEAGDFTQTKKMVLIK